MYCKKLYFMLRYLRKIHNIANLYCISNLTFNKFEDLKKILLRTYEMTYKVIFFNFFIETHYY